MSKTKVLIVDNYDSFTWNLYHYVEQFTDSVDVVFNDKINPDVVNTYTHILLSPGPGLPSEAGQMPEIIKRFHPHKKILGICLGMQAIVEFCGGALKNLPQVLHGVSTICHKTTIHEPLLEGLNHDFQVGHYHSWVADEKLIPKNLAITSKNKDGLIMSVRHHEFDLVGIQFHPESVLTPDGILIIKHWLEIL